MTRRMLFSLGAVLAIGLLTFVIKPASADRALVVGVDAYPALPPDCQLAGAANDARGMGAKLTSAGFEVTVLTDARATRHGILGQLAQIKRAIGANERFVFYFAGHGSKDPNGKGVILASDASAETQSNYITQDELYQSVSAITARARTVILDSCFSGAMSRAFDLTRASRPHLRSRFVNFFSLPRKLVLTCTVNNNDNPSPQSNTGQICYYVATSKYQEAYEDVIDGKTDGLFTHYLLADITPEKKRWSKVQTDVSGNVIANSGGIQTPYLSPGYEPVTVFDSKDQAGEAPAPSSPKTIWDVFSEDDEDTSKLLLAMNPDRSTVRINEKFEFDTTVGTQGYLVVMEKDTDGCVNLVFPASRDVDDALEQAGSVARLPAAADRDYTVDKEGVERIKAVLFSSRDAAAQVLAAFPADGVVKSVQEAQEIMVQVKDSLPFYTSAVGFEVSGVE